MDREKIFSAEDARDFDKKAQEQLGIPSIILMENAGRSTAEEALKMVTGQANIAVVCGTGNNGGDGMVAARQLLNTGKKITVYLIGNEKKLKPDPLVNFSILRNIKSRIVNVKSLADIKAIRQANLIIDAIFGIGLNSPVQGIYVEIINYLNQTNQPILSIDIPSGLDTDTGQILGTAIKATKTITFVAAKKGFYLADGPRHCGKIVVRRIY